jgi:hypothetical protein
METQRGTRARFVYLVRSRWAAPEFVAARAVKKNPKNRFKRAQTALYNI